MDTATQLNSGAAEVTSVWLARVGRRAGQTRALRLTRAPDCISPWYVERGPCTAVFAGLLHNRRDLANEVAFGEEAHNDADLVLRAYERWGRDCPLHMRGVFAFVICDSEREIIFGARDRVGIHPLFWAFAGHDLILSPSITALLSDPHVSRDFNRPAMVDHLRHTWGDRPTETFYTAVSRVPAGHAFEAKGGQVRVWPYWDLLREGAEIDWFTESDVARFDSVLDRAVERCLDLGPSGIFLSGGLDSVSVAASAVDVARARGRPAPIALSIAFPDPKCNEEPVQRAVAARLGLAQLMLPIEKTVQPDGLLWAGLCLGAQLEAPLSNTWAPAYYELRLEARRRGCEVVMTGNGGDEWLGVNPKYLADLIRKGHLAGVVQMLRNQLRSYDLPPLALLRRLLVGYGLRPLAAMYLNRWLRRLAPGVIGYRNRRRLAAVTPAWLAPDPALHQEARRRFEEVSDVLMRRPEPDGPHGFYNSESPRSRIQPLTAMEFEEAFELSRRTGVFELAPYWDADLVEFLKRTPPELLERGGRAKGLVRDTVARRLPDLGFSRQRKVSALRYFGSVLAAQGPIAWKRLGGAQVLAKLGVAAPDLSEHASALFAGRDRVRLARIIQMHRVLDVMHLEAWVRPRAI